MRKSLINAKEEKSKKVDFLIGLGYSVEDAEKNRLKVSSCNSYLYWMYKEGLTKEESINKVSILQKSKSPRCKEYWISKGYTEKESLDLVSKYQDNVSLEITLKKGGCIEDYNRKCKNRKITKSVYIKIYGEKIGTKKWEEKKHKSSQTLKNMINRHGIKEGEYKWNSYIEKQRYSQSEKCLLEKHGEIKGSEIWNFRKNLVFKKILDFKNTGDFSILSRSTGYSKSSQKMFWSIYNKLPNSLKEKCYFHEKNHEFVLYENGTCYLYDFVISNIKLCIEFNGDIWHANPSKYKKDDIVFGKTASDIWDKDNRKISLLKTERDIETIVIWESDWIKNKIETEKELLEVILNYTPKLEPHPQTLVALGLLHSNPFPLSPPE